jgi:hypothetical protein
MQWFNLCFFVFLIDYSRSSAAVLLLIKHVVNVKTLNGSEHDGRSFFSFFLLKLKMFRGEGKILMRHTHDTTFSEKNLDFYKI